MRAKTFPTLLAAGLLAACGTSGPTLPSDDGEFMDDSRSDLPDLVQTRIQTASLFRAVWIPGSRAVAAVAGGARPWAGDCTIELIDADSHAISALTGPVACSWLLVSPDGTGLYYGVFVNPMDSRGEVRIRRLTISSLISESVFTVPSELDHMVLSPDGKRIAYIAGTQVYLHDLATSTTSLLASMAISGDWSGLAFSPDGAGLLYVADDNSPRRVLRLGLDPISSAWLPVPIHATPPQLSWTTSGIQYVVESAGGWVLANITTGERLNMHGDDETLTWSADGRHVVGVRYWGGAFGFAYRGEMVIGDWPTQKVTAIARESSDLFTATPKGMAVSPDGATVIYGMRSGTYIWHRQ